MKTTVAGVGLCLVALLACKQEETQGSPGKPVASTPAVVAPSEPAAPASAKPAEEAPKPSTRPLTDDEIAVLKKSMASGTTVIKEQSFLVEFKDIGECSFVSALAPNKREFVFFLFRNGKVYQGLVTYEKLKNWVPGAVNAVTFKDVNGDGLKDIVVLAQYMPGSKKVSAAIVFMRKGANFKLDQARSNKAAAAGNDVNRAVQLAR